MLSIMADGYNFSLYEASFREFLVSENVSLVTIKNYLSDLRHFLSWSSWMTVSTDHAQDSHILDYQNVANYASYMSSSGLPKSTIKRRLSSLKKFFSFAVGQKWIESNPFNKLAGLSEQSDDSGTKEKFLEYLKKNGVTDGDLDYYNSVVGSFIRFCKSVNN